MTDGPTHQVVDNPRTLVGSWRRFGTAGPVYQIIAIGRGIANDQPLLRIRVVESGEELDYPVVKALDDPPEH